MLKSVAALLLLFCVSLLPPAPVRADVLGLSVQTMDDRLRASYRIAHDYGLFVHRVAPGSPAGTAGILGGDVVLQLDGRQLRTPAQIDQIVYGYSPGITIMAIVLRGEHVTPMPITLPGGAPGLTPAPGINKHLTGEEIYHYIIGNSLSGTTVANNVYCEYFNPNGTIKGLDTLFYTGRWSIDGNLLCFDYPGPDDDGCQSMHLAGSRVSAYENGRTFTGTAALQTGDTCR